MRFASLQEACNVVTGDQDFLIPGAQTPIGAIATFSSGTAVGTAVAGSILGWSIMDGTTAISVSAFSQDSSASSSDTGGRTNLTSALNIVLPTGTGQDGLASFVSFQNSGGNVGVRVNWSNAPATALMVNWIFIFPDTGDEAIHVGTHATPATQTTNDYTSSPFEPNVALFFTPSLGTTYNGLRVAAGFACNNNGTTQQGCSSIFETDAADPTDPRQFASSDRCAGIVDGAHQRVTAWLSNGLTFETLVANASSTLIFMLLKTKGRVWVGAPAIGVHTGAGSNKTVSDPGFPVETVFAIGTKVPIATLNTTVSDTDAGKLSWGFGTVRDGGFDQCAAIMITDADSAPNQTTRSQVEEGVLEVIDEDLGSAYELGALATISSGFTLSLSAENLSADRIVVFLGLARPTIVTSETVRIQEGQAFTRGLSATETVNVVEGSRIIHSAFLANETVNIQEGAVALSSSMQETEVGTIVEATVLVTSAGTEFMLSTTEVVTVVEAATLVHSALINNETVEIYENTIFVGTGVGVTANETEHIMEGAVLVLGQVMTLSEIENILEGFSFGEGLIVIKRAGGRGQTVQGGALAAVTTQGGAERGETQSG